MHLLRPQKPKKIWGTAPDPPERRCFIWGAFNKHVSCIHHRAWHSVLSDFLVETYFDPCLGNTISTPEHVDIGILCYIQEGATISSKSIFASTRLYEGHDAL